MNINKYFDENVVSIGFDTEAGHVSTSQKERMVVVHGELVVQLPNTQEWLSFPAGTEFNVDANVEFNVKVATPTAYLCYYS
jgi:uncharacterized protein YaiE (UPF0345 family)